MKHPLDKHPLSAPADRVLRTPRSGGDDHVEREPREQIPPAGVPGTASRNDVPGLEPLEPRNAMGEQQVASRKRGGAFNQR